jgi:signal transduction histidine kinase
VLDSIGFDVLALLLSGLATATVAAVHGLLWLSLRRRAMARWALAFTTLALTDLAQIGLSQVTSAAAGRVFGASTLAMGLLIPVLFWRALEDSRGASPVWIRRSSAAFLALGVLSLAWAIGTEPATAESAGMWYRSAGNAALRAVFAIQIVAVAVAAWRVALQRTGTWGARLLAIGFTIAVSRPLLISQLATRAITDAIAAGVALTLFSFVFDALLVGIGSVLLVLDEERARAISRARQAALVDRMDRLGLMAGSVAHDLNNVLMSVTASLQMARDPALSPQEVQEELRHTQTAVDHGRAMARGLLSFAKGERGMPGVLSLGRFVAEHEDALARVLGPPHRLTVVTEDGGDGTVRVDPTRLQQLVQNAVLNSREAVGDARAVQVRIGVRAERLPAPQAIGMFELPAGTWLVLQIADDGPGFPPAALDRVFEPMFSTKGAGGTGLGLATAYAVARDAGGAVHAFNGPDGGAIVEAWFPAVP